MADDAAFDASSDVLTATAQGRLRSIIERLERLEEDKQAVMTDMKEVFAEAKGEGYDVKILRKVIRIRRSAEKAGVSLSEWEGEFLDSVGERVKTHGRAFADPEKGAPGQALSAMQGRKLKEITAKAKGEEPKRRWGRKKEE